MIYIYIAMFFFSSPKTSRISRNQSEITIFVSVFEPIVLQDYWAVLKKNWCFGNFRPWIFEFSNFVRQHPTFWDNPRLFETTIIRKDLPSTVMFLESTVLGWFQTFQILKLCCCLSLVFLWDKVQLGETTMNLQSHSELSLGSRIVVSYSSGVVSECRSCLTKVLKLRTQQQLNIRNFLNV